MLTNIRNWIKAVSFAVIVVVILPWKGIYGKNVTIHQVNPDDWVQECATVYQDTCCQWDRGNYSYYVNYSAYDIIEKPPSGLCKPEFSCAWSGCIPDNYQSLTETRGAFVSDFLSVDIDVNTTYSDIESVLGPGLNLPDKITFPTEPSDIIEAIQHAKEEGMTVSIMSTGHSYTGASTSAGSVQLNLRSYPKYSKSSIVECGYNSNDQGVAISRNAALYPDKSPACKLATARGKKAFVRVGGGEIFNDVASSVFALKDDNTGYSKYMMLHGVGTVGAAGGWLQGGGLGWGQERVWGLGVDQVLEIEMVLADERHVKFYPTEWEDAKGFLYPKTKKVEGLCNTNVFADEESMWVWEPCNDPAPQFEDLWFAVRGGGGGTYGVLTSVNIQLHDNIPVYGLSFNESRTANDQVKFNYTTDEITDISGKVAYCRTNFALDFLFNPEIINVTTNTSNHCGSPGMWFAVPNLYCLGKDAADTAKDSYDRSMTSCANEVFPEYLDILPDVLEQFYIDGPHDSLISFVNNDGGLNINVPGQLVDDGPSILPQGVPYSGWSSAQVPESWLASKNDDVIDTFVFKQGYGSHVTGGNVAIAHDQMNAVPLPERQSGLSSAGFGYLPLDLQERLLTTFLNETISTGKSFPGITEFNHIASYSYGPLKSDMTKMCPDDFNTEEKEDKCFSMQESVWGVELTEKLEGIKYAVDPEHLFYCYGCIEPKEHNLIKDATTSVHVSSPTELPSKGVQFQMIAVEDLDSASPTFLLQPLVTFLMGGSMVLISLLL